MSEKSQEIPQLTYKEFNGLSETEQRLLLYYGTILETSDIGIEELFSPIAGIAEKEEEVLDAINGLETQGLLNRGYNPRRKKNLTLSPEKGRNRLYVTPDVHKFVTQDLPRIWKEKGSL